MKKIVLLLILTLFVSLALADPWAHRYDTWQTEEYPSINTGNTQIFAVEWGEGDWTSTQLGYGTSTDGTDWTWIDLPWIQNGVDNNKRCSTTVTFNSEGTYYYVYKMVKDGDWHHDGDLGWSLCTSDFSSIVTSSYVTVTDLPTPICLASFTAEAKKGTVELAWVTESETENAHFLVYRDGEVLAQVEGAGTTSETHSYSYLDTRVQAGIHSYAIADVTYGGVEELHEAVEVEVKAEAEVAAAFTLGKAYPNPFNPKTVITMHYTVGSQAVVNIYNFQGELVETLADGFMSAGTHQLTWDATAMPSGIYLVSLQAGSEIQTTKIVLMK